VQIAGGAPVKDDVRLRELHMGEWEGRPWESFRGIASEDWALDPWNRRPPGGETAAEFWARVADLREEILGAGSKRMAVVTHAGVIRAWRGRAENRPFDAMMLEPVAFGSVHLAG
jgi:alpha-ribazole phosphatase